MAGSISLRRGQTRTLAVIFWEPDKASRTDLTGKTIEIVANTLPIEPILTVTDAVEGEATIRLEAAEDDTPRVYSFVVRLDADTENEIDWPPIEVKVL